MIRVPVCFVGRNGGDYEDMKTDTEKKLQEIYDTAWPAHKEMIDEWKAQGMTAEQILPYAELFM